MADQNEQSNSNSHLKKDLQQQQHEKHQNQPDISDVLSSLAIGNAEPKAITNIYYCRERNFDFLDLQTLLNVARVRLPHSEHIVLQNYTAESVAKFLHANPQLHHLTFIPKTAITFDQVVNMLAGNSSILKLDIVEALVDMNEVDLNRFTMQCPMIKDLSVSCRLTSGQAFILINQLGSLKRFKFSMNDRLEFDSLVARMDNAWKHSFHFDDHVVTYLSEREQ